MGNDTRNLKQRVASYALEFPQGSAKRKKLMAVLASVFETYTTEGGTPFKMRTVDFARFLQERMNVRPGAEMGSYLREEKQIPEGEARTLKEYGAKIRIGPARKERDPWELREKGPDINLLWDRLNDAIWAQVSTYGADAGDYFVNMPASYEDDQFEQYLSGISGDLALNWEHDLGSRAQKWWDKLALAMKTGIYKGGRHEDWSPRHRKTLLGETYADAWHDAMLKGWRRIQKNPKEMVRLRSMRPSRR